MRDPARIERVLGLIRAIWTRYPDLRLGQLMEMAASRANGPGPEIDRFYMEDDLLESGLRSLKIDGKVL